MRTSLKGQAIWLSALLVGSATAQAPNNEPDYSIDHPYTEPAKPNGLAIEKPNFILFMPDQLRYDSVGIFGNDVSILSIGGESDCLLTRKQLVNTPNIDAFAREGTRFTNTYTQASVCSQSRCSIFTGQYPHVSGHRTLENLLKPWEPNLFKSLKESGYHVAYLSPRGDFYAANATELSVNEYGFLTSQTLPEFSSPPYQSDKDDILNRVFYKGERNATQALDYDEVMVRGALQWLERPPQDKPWVLFLPLLFPHCPFTVEEPYFSMYDRSEMPLPIERDEMSGYQPRFIDTINKAYGLDRATPELWREVKATYYGMISRLDEQFGRVVNATKQHGLWNSTVTMFFTDHGEFLGDYGLIEKWPSGLNEQLTHEPLVIGGAGLPQGSVYEEMAEMVDLVPTMLQLASVGESYMHFGKSLVDAIHAAGRGEVLPHKEHAYTEGGFLLNEEPLLEQGPFPYDIKSALQHNDTALVGKSVAIRDKEWTYVYRLYEADELYFRRNDTYELNNLAAEPEYQHIRAKMRETVLKWMMETSDVIPWYKDQRAPDVDLPSPYEQYLGRGEGEL